MAKSIFLYVDNLSNLVKDYSIEKTHFLKLAKTRSSRLLKYHLPGYDYRERFVAAAGDDPTEKRRVMPP